MDADACAALAINKRIYECIHFVSQSAALNNGCNKNTHKYHFHCEISNVSVSGKNSFGILTRHAAVGEFRTRTCISFMDVPINLPRGLLLAVNVEIDIDK